MTEPSQKTYVNLSPGRGASSSREDDLYKAVQATVASDYELLGELGRGDRGRVVYLARELASGSLVALRLDRGGASEAEYELTVLPHLDETVPSAGSGVWSSVACSVWCSVDTANDSSGVSSASVGFSWRVPASPSIRRLLGYSSC